MLRDPGMTCPCCVRFLLVRMFPMYVSEGGYVIRRGLAWGPEIVVLFTSVDGRDLWFIDRHLQVVLWILCYLFIFVSIFLDLSSHGFGLGYFHLDGTVPRLGIIQTDCLATVSLWLNIYCYFNLLGIIYKTVGSRIRFMIFAICRNYIVGVGDSVKWGRPPSQTPLYDFMERLGGHFPRIFCQVA
jgi:hypothetical protein